MSTNKKVGGAKTTPTTHKQAVESNTTSAAAEAEQRTSTTSSQPVIAPATGSNADHASGTTTIVAATMSPEEKASLEHYEKAIAQGLSCFQEVGAALMAIRDGKLYREQFKTFEAYLKSKWGIGRAHAYRLIEAKKIVSALSPRGDTEMILPAQEAHVRPLAKLKPENRQAAWTAAVAKAGLGPVTAKMVKEEAAKFEPMKWKKARKKNPVTPTDAGASSALQVKEDLKKVLGLVNQVDNLVKESSDPKTIRNFISQARNLLMNLMEG